MSNRPLSVHQRQAARMADPARDPAYADHLDGNVNSPTITHFRKIAQIEDPDRDPEALPILPVYMPLAF